MIQTMVRLLGSPEATLTAARGHVHRHVGWYVDRVC
jgi:hypothetical protein